MAKRFRPMRYSEPHTVSAGSGHYDLRSARHFELAVSRYVEGRTSIDTVRAFIAFGDPYITLGYWPGLPAFALDAAGDVDIDATLGIFRNIAASAALQAAP